MKEDHKYSYSQLSQFDTCPYSFFLARIQGAPQVENAFAQQGTLIHDLIDKWAKGEVKKEALAEEYVKRHTQEVTAPWPRMLAKKGYAEKAIEIGAKYFEQFDCFAGYTILETEHRYETTIAGRPFVGIVDMVLKDEVTDEIIIVDHKSKSSAAFKKAADEMYRQQLLYAKFIKEKYGFFPDRMMFNLFKENGEKHERPFTQDDYLEAMTWAEKTIQKIETYDDLDWLTCKEPDFFCKEICSVHTSCPNGTPVYKKRISKGGVS